MNSLGHVHGHRLIGFATALWLLASTSASAQFALPNSATAPPKTNTPAAVTPTTPTVSGKQLIAATRAAMKNRDFKTAVQSYQQLAAIAPTAPDIIPDVARLRLDLQLAGVDAASLTAKPAARLTPMPAMPSVRSAPAPQPIATSNATRKRDALRMVALGRAALDKGDAATALQYARQAQSLKVPEKDFAPGEPRVWEFVLDAESAARRVGLPTANQGAVQQAAGVAPSAGQNVISQMLHTENHTDPSPKIQQVQALDVNVQALNDGEEGAQLFRDGMAALAVGDRDTAKLKFTEAWRYEGQLDLTTRRQLKDKLTLLQRPTLLGQKTAAMDTPIDRAELQAAEEAQQLYRDVSSELARVGKLRVDSPLDALDQLNRLRRRVDASSVDQATRRSIGTMVDKVLAEQKQYVEANRANIELELKNEAIKMEMAAEDEREIRIDEEISGLVETFNDLIEERRFQEAEVVAKKVSELKPESPIAISMFHVSRMGTRRLINQEISDKKEKSFWTHMTGVENSSYNELRDDQPVSYSEAKTWRELTLRRLTDRYDDSHLSDNERAIKRKMTDTVKVTYNERPLGEVLEDLSAMTGIPIALDRRSLDAVRVNSASQVSLNVPNGVKLQSALNLILNQLELTYVIENDVLNITSMEARRSKVYPKTYRVTDLVTPIPNFTTSYDDGLAGALRAAYQMTQPQTNVQIMPVSTAGLASGASNRMTGTNPTMLGQFGGMGGGMGSQGGFGPNNPPMAGNPMGRGGGGAIADFDSLIQLIQQTVVPDTWEALGGPSTMAPYPQNLSLVISTTSDVHDQITDLLASLRALQNLQITIEVRFITLSDTFFEQIGVDFDVQFDDNTQQLPSDDAGPSVAIGFDGISGLPTADLDIQFNNNSFGVTPPFGAPDVGAISSVGFAILSDIEAFFFLQAAQGDNRNNVMQAPKVTLFDGQFASISDVTQRPFVTGITPVVGDFAVAQQPVIMVLNEGTQLNVQGIVSDDKRYVRLTLIPNFSQIGNVDTFTFEGRRSTVRNSRNENGDTNNDGVVDENDAVDTEEEQDVFEGTTVQLPTFAFTQVSTTVSVPDGGTILLGGIKRLAEGRAERGVPVLSKIPYLSRLFRNVAVGRDARSLMLMVTPRIIIQEEEEIAQTGFSPNQ